MFLHLSSLSLSLFLSRSLFLLSSLLSSSMSQALASVSFLLPLLKADPRQRLLIRVCKDPWAKLKSAFFAARAGAWQCGVERYAVELLAALGVPLSQVDFHPPPPPRRGGHYSKHDTRNSRRS